MTQTVFQDGFVTTIKLSPEAHADMHFVIQRRVNSSIFIIVNVISGYTIDQIEGVYSSLYARGAGGTVL